MILPVPDPLQKSHYDLALLQLAIRNVANYSPPVIGREPDQPDEWEVLARLALAFQNGPDDPAVIDEMAIRALIEPAISSESSSFFGRTVDDVLEELGPRTGPERILDFMLRSGPYGLTLDDLIAHPHGIDLGPLEARLPDVLRTPSGMIELAPEPLVADVGRLEAALATHPADGMVLVGRRDLRSNNSWMHNISVLVKGKARCTLHIHPEDAVRLGLVDGAPARVTSATGAVTIPVEVTDAIMRGVVSIPHGWGHDLDGVALSTASTKAAGVNSNLLADDTLFDPLSGNAVLNGIPVEVAGC